MEIKVLGAGCAKCKTTYERIGEVIAAHGLDATLTKVEDIMEMLQYNVMTTPAIVIDGVVRLKGYVPSTAEIEKLLGL